MKLVCVVDQGSRSQCAMVVVRGVPLMGIVDTGANITRLGVDAFKRVASVTKLKKRDFKQPDEVPRNYDQQPFHINGRLDIDFEFQDKTMMIPVYVKKDAPKQLFLPKGVCRQLRILTYHPEVQYMGRNKGGKDATQDDSKKDGDCIVPTVRV